MATPMAETCGLSANIPNGSPLFVRNEVRKEPVRSYELTETTGLKTRLGKSILGQVISRASSILRTVSVSACEQQEGWSQKWNT